VRGDVVTSAAITPLLVIGEWLMFPEFAQPFY
jgi:hypothetical protein